MTTAAALGGATASGAPLRVRPGPFAPAHRTPTMPANRSPPARESPLLPEAGRTRRSPSPPTWHTSLGQAPRRGPPACLRKPARLLAFANAPRLRVCRRLSPGRVREHAKFRHARPCARAAPNQRPGLPQRLRSRDPPSERATSLRTLPAPATGLPAAAPPPRTLRPRRQAKLHLIAIRIARRAARRAMHLQCQSPTRTRTPPQHPTRLLPEL